MIKRILSIYLFLLAFLGGVSTAAAGTLEFTVASLSIAENGSSFEVSVSRSGDVTATATATVNSVAGTATAGEDFSTTSQVLSWGAEDIADKTLTVSILDDGAIEDTETFTLALQTLVGDTAGTNTVLTVSVTDYEEGELSFAVESYSFPEYAGSAEVNILRQSGQSGDVTVTLTTVAGTAVIDGDFEESQVVLEILDGETSKSVTFSLTNDSIAEFDETFEISLSVPTGGATLGDITTTTVTVTDSDTDFTPALIVIDNTSDEILQPALVNMAQPSPYDSALSLLETINLIDVVKNTDLIFAQGSDGLIEIAIGDEILYLRPIAAARTSLAADTAIIIRDDESGRLVTDQGVGIDFQPGLKGLSVLQSELAAAAMPELTVTAQGNITVQVNQGTPPLERNDDGVVVINNRYWDRFNLRPSLVSFLSPAKEEGILLIPHPSLANESSVLVFYTVDSELRQQLLEVAPLDYGELSSYVEQAGSISNVRLLGNGLVELAIDSSTNAYFSDYVIRRVVNFEASQVGIFETEDVNDDGLADYNVVYSTGDEQYLLSISP
jgi:hypothetical protein